MCSPRRRRPLHPPLPGEGEDEDEGAAAAAASPDWGKLGAASGGGVFGLWTAVFEYEACAEDELSLRPGDVVQVLSQDSQVSGDEGWWTGRIEQRVGIFPSNYVTSSGSSSSRLCRRHLGPASAARYPQPPAIQCKEDGTGLGGGNRWSASWEGLPLRVLLGAKARRRTLLPPAPSSCSALIVLRTGVALHRFLPLCGLNAAG